MIHPTLSTGQTPRQVLSEGDADSTSHTHTHTQVLSEGDAAAVYGRVLEGAKQQQDAELAQLLQLPQLPTTAQVQFGGEPRGESNGPSDDQSSNSSGRSLSALPGWERLRVFAGGCGLYVDWSGL